MPLRHTVRGSPRPATVHGLKGPLRWAPRENVRVRRPKSCQLAELTEWQGLNCRDNCATDCIGGGKHGLWIPGGAYGSICPQFTHEVDGRKFGVREPESWDRWPRTVVQRLLTTSVPHNGRGHAAERGLAVCAQETIGGTWHGHPILRRKVPFGARNRLINMKQTTSTEIRKHLRHQKSIDPNRNLQWAVLQ